jgi:predicted DNA-binding protein
MPARYPTITIRISEQTEDLLDLLATLQGVNKSQVVKQALNCYIQDHIDPDHIDSKPLD